MRLKVGGFNPLYIGSSCNSESLVKVKKSPVSIPFISGQVVIVDLKELAKSLGFNPLYIGSSCNKGFLVYSL